MKAFALPAVDCSLWCSAVLASSYDRVHNDVVFIVAVPPELHRNSSNLQKADHTPTDRLVLKMLFFP